MSTTIPPTTPTPPPTPKIVNKKVPPALLWGGIATIIGVPLVALIYKFLFPSDTPSGSGSWLIWLAWIVLACVVAYTVFTYLKKSDGKVAAKVGFGFVIMFVAYAVAVVVLGDRATTLLDTGFGAARSGVDRLTQGSGGGGATSVAQPTVIEMKRGETSKRFNVDIKPFEVYRKGGQGDISVCLRPVGDDAVKAARIRGHWFKLEKLEDGALATPHEGLKGVYGTRPLPIEIRIGSPC